MDTRSAGTVTLAALEDVMHAHLAKKTPEERKATLVSWHNRGLMDTEYVAFWFYVFGLEDE